MFSPILVYVNFPGVFKIQFFHHKRSALLSGAVYRNLDIQISVADTDPHLKRPPGSAWRVSDPDPGGKKA